jgi:hypothetical protein
MVRRVIERDQAPGWLVWAALGVVYVVWGSTYLAIAVVVKTMPAPPSLVIEQSKRWNGSAMSGDDKTVSTVTARPKWTAAGLAAPYVWMVAAATASCSAVVPN